MSVPGPILTERDSALLLDIYKYRYLSVYQIQALHFPSLQTTYRRLRALSKLGYVKGFLSPRISQSLYCLSKLGVAWVAENLQVSIADLKWHRTDQTPKDYYFLEHFLKTTDFRIALNFACHNAAISLLGFIPEFYGEKTIQNGVAKYIKDKVCDIANQTSAIEHTPDGVFALERNQIPALFFLEIDRGTETISDENKGVLRSVKFYLNYLVSGQYQRYQADFQSSPFRAFRALFITTSPQRVENIRRSITQLPFDDNAKRFIWLTDEAKVSATTLFQPIWLSGDRADATLYRIG